MKLRTVLIFVAIISLGYSLWGCLCGMNVYDEGIIVSGAQRVLSGDIIYRDFWTIYPPGQFWLLALVFKFFGSTLLVERFLTVLINVSIAIIFFLIVRKFARLWLSIVVWLLLLFWVNTYGFASPAPTALLFVLLSSLFLIRFFFGKMVWDLFLCGLFCGLVLLFRHDFGIFTLLGQLAILVGYLVSMRGSNVIRTGLLYLLGWLVIFLPFATYLLMAVHVKEMFRDLFVIPVTVFPRARWLSYPFILPSPLQIFSRAATVSEYFRQVVLRLDYYFPFVIYVVSLISVRNSIRKPERPLPVKVWIMGFFLLLGLLLYIQGFIRGHISHLRPTFIPAIILLAFLMEEVIQFSKRFYVVIIVFIIFVFAMAWVPLLGKLGAVNATRLNHFYFNIPRAENIVWDKRGKNYQDLVVYIKRNVPENERIFVGNARHDRLFSSDVMLYFLSERPSASRYYELVPGVADTEPVQREIISDLERFGVRYIIICSYEVLEPNQSGVSSGVRLLDNFIREKFSLDREFGDYACWKRR